MRTRRATNEERDLYQQITRPIMDQMKELIQVGRGKLTGEIADSHRKLSRQMTEACNQHRFHVSKSGLRIRLD